MIIYLYIKQCSHCNLKYFGKTKTADPFNYQGSGLYWQRHLKFNKSNAITIDIFGFDNQNDCTEFALKFSKDNNIIKSKKWANLCVENGLGGGNLSTPESRNKISKSLLGKKMSEKRKAQIKIRINLNPRKHLEETKIKMSLAKRPKMSDETKEKLRLSAKNQWMVRRQRFEL